MNAAYAQVQGRVAIGALLWRGVFPLLCGGLSEEDYTLLRPVVDYAVRHHSVGLARCALCGVGCSAARSLSLSEYAEVYAQGQRYLQLKSLLTVFNLLEKYGGRLPPASDAVLVRGLIHDEALGGNLQVAEQALASLLDYFDGPPALNPCPWCDAAWVDPFSTPLRDGVAEPVKLFKELPTPPVSSFKPNAVVVQACSGPGWSLPAFTQVEVTGTRGVDAYFSEVRDERGVLCTVLSSNLLWTSA